jgi:iron complex outermembrane receptor protein
VRKINSSIAARSAVSVAVYVAMSLLAAPFQSARADEGASKSASPAPKIAFNIPSAPLADSLAEWSKQSGLQVLKRQTAKRDEIVTPQVSGSFSATEALDRLLANTGLRYEFVNDRTVRIVPIPEEHDAAASRGIAEILVQGSRLLNMDLKRSRDDAQPYVIYERESIERSGARSVEDFLRQRLPMNTAGQSYGQSGASQLGNISQVNLRGLGSNQTLILVDGHRTADLNFGGDTFQSDVNGIPLGAIERIEVLPTTASGIYGGNATGGVVNIVLRRDYSGSEVKLTYENSFDVSSRQVRADFAAGFNLEDGKTNVLLAGSYSDSDTLLYQDSDLVKRGIATIRANNPTFYTQAVNPPLGATANIRSVNGSPLFGPGSSNITFVPDGYAGGGGLAPLQANAGNYNYDLAPTRQQGERSLLNAPTVYSVSSTIRRQFTDSIQAFLEGAASNNESVTPQSSVQTNFTLGATAPNNPFGQAVRVTVPIAAAGYETSTVLKERRLLGGLIFKLPQGWQGEADFTWDKTGASWVQAQSLTAATGTALQNGTLDILRDTRAYPITFTDANLLPNDRTIEPFDATLRDWAVRAGGPVSLPFAALPTISLSGMLEYRDTALSRTSILSAGGTYIYPDRSYNVASAYLEARIPIVDARNARTGLRELELQLAGRHDRYITHGATGFLLTPTAPVTRITNESQSTDPTFGLRFVPVRDVQLRASYGTGFRVPSTSQLAPTTPILSNANGTIVDPRRGNEPIASYYLTQGGNPTLQPEESKSWSFGTVLTPRWIPDLRASVDYTRVKKTDNISSLSTLQILDNESRFPGRVTRAAPAPGDPFGVGVITGIDVSAINVASTNTEAFDMALDYSLNDTPVGAFSFFLVGTWQTHLQTQLLPSEPVKELVGISSGFGSNTSSGIPVKFKANVGTTWKWRDWTLGWTTRYYDDYLAADPTSASSAATVLNQGGGGRVKSQAYHDLIAGYRLPQNIEVQAGIKNVFNKKPPFDAGAGSMYYSYLGDPRLASYWLSLKAAF